MQDNFVRTILQNEVTKLVAIFGVVWTIIVTVILPINNIQLNLAQLNEKVSSSDKEDVAVREKVDTNTKDIIKLDGRITALERR